MLFYQHGAKDSSFHKRIPFVSFLLKQLPLEYIFTKPKTFNQTTDKLYREYNQWGPEDLEQQWFVRFLRRHFPDNKTVVNFFGPVSSPFFIKRKFEGKKVIMETIAWIRRTCPWGSGR